MREMTVDASGCRLFVRDWGDNGPALLLLHGGGSDVSTWDALAPRLAGDFRVIAYDARGHGQSEVPKGGGRHSLLDDVLLFAERGMTSLGEYTEAQRAAIARLRVPTRWFDTGHGIHEELPDEVATAIHEFANSL